MRYGVIGAGVLGLTVALELVESGHQVEVFERGDVPGGLAASFEVAPGIWLERYYHHIFRSDRSAIALIRRLGIEDHLEWHRPTSTVMASGRPIPLDSPSSLLRFHPLPRRDRVRLAAAIAFLKMLPSPALLEDWTADAWMRAAAGGRAHEVIWSPLLHGKFGDAADVVSMAWLWARLHDRTRDLGYLRGGFHLLYEALASRVSTLGGSIRYGVAVSQVVRGGQTLELRVDTGSIGSFDRVVSTLPRSVTEQIAPGLDPPADLAGSGYAPRTAHCLILALDRPLTGIYWIGATDPSWPFLAVVEHTAMLSPSDYGGLHLIYLGAYRNRTDEHLRLSVEDQVGLALPMLRELNPRFGRDWVTRAWSFTAANAQPIVDVGYARHIEDFDTNVPGLYMANMFQVYPHDRGQNYSIDLGRRLVKRLSAQPS